MTGRSDDPDSPSLEERLSRMEERLADAPAPPQPALDRILRLLPLFTLGNLLMALPALLISFAVAYFSFVQAEATRKMQVAEVWPRVLFDTANALDDGTPRLALSLANQGVGPALIRAVEIRHAGRPQTSLDALLTACCNSPQDWTLMVEDVNETILRPGQEVSFAILQPGLVPPETYRAFDRARFGLGVRVCYCSVFDDCWIARETGADPEPVASCPADWVRFGHMRRGPQPVPAYSSSSMSQ